jgi:two-component system cell cycle sensor histidine kinase/response regulator CckA
MPDREAVDRLQQPAVLIRADGSILHANAHAVRAFDGIDLVGASLDDLAEGSGCCIAVLQGEPRASGEPDWLVAQRVERLQLVTETTGIGLFDRQILRDDAPPPWWSDTMREMLAFPPDRDADPDWFFERVHPEDQTRMQAAIEKADQIDGNVEVEVRWLHPDGRERTLLIRSCTLRSETDTSFRSFGIVMDLTDQRQQSAAMRELEDRVRQMQKMDAIGRLAGGVAHDFNNLLLVILGASDMIQKDLGPDHPNAADVQSVLAAAERAAALTRQLLAFGRKQFLQPTILDLDELMGELAPLVSRMVEDSVVIQVHPSEEPVRTHADRSQLTQVVMNLVLNARDAMPDGGRIIIETASVVVEAGEGAERLAVSPGAYAVLSVSDDGVGMDEATRSRVFEPFFTTKDAGRGTGLGLATVYGIVRQTGGTVWVYSEPDMGSTFKVYLPASDQPLSPRSEQVEPPVLPDDVTVLLTDDDPDVRSVVQRILGRAGLTVHAADSPQEAIELFRELDGGVDLLITDVLMPDMTGKQLAEQFLALDPYLTVLYMSGYTENSIVHHGVLDDGVHFISKPITPARLLAAIAAALAG